MLINIIFIIPYPELEEKVNKNIPKSPPPRAAEKEN